MQSDPRVIDLFAGAGLFSHAFAATGFHVVRAIEIEPAAAATYQANLGDHIEVADIRRVEPAGTADVLVAGPPCQGFSTLGKRDPSDPRNRLSLIVGRWAEALKPRVVVVENVPGFLDSTVCKTLVQRLRRQGYVVHTIVLDALAFGVAQRRRRSFVLASLGAPVEVRRTRREDRPLTVREALRGLPRKPDGKNWHVATRPSSIAMARMQHIPHGGDKRDVMEAAPHLAPPSWWRMGCEVTDAWGRLRWDAPANTLRTTLQNASKGRYIHPSQDRVISIREAARLHSIPDNWQFRGVRYQVARQIGNSVPPRMGAAVARAVMRTLHRN